MASFIPYGNRQASPRNAKLIQQHNMVGSMFVDRGLLNKPGENNCFLNSAIQVLWHIDVFRRSFRQLEGHYCHGDSCIFCALQAIYLQYQYTDQSAIPPNALRSALAKCFESRHKFQLGLMEDASECYDEILTQIHFHLVGNHDEDTCSVPHCISHQKFAMTLLERSECKKCGATSEPLSMVQFIHYYSVTALIVELEKTKQANLSVEKDHALFAKMLHNAYCIDNHRECPNYMNCQNPVRPQQILLNSLDVLCIGLIWDSDQPTVRLIQLLTDCIGLYVKLGNLFDQTLTEESKRREYNLTAVVTYYGKHYSTFCYHGSHKEWVYLDDANVRKVGQKWKDVKDLFKKGHYQPLMLMYTYTNAKPISVETAPVAKIDVAQPQSSNSSTTTSTATTSSNQSGLQTNATPIENTIIGGKGSNQQQVTIPPPPQHNKTQHNVTTDVTPQVTNGFRESSPVPVRNSPRASPRGVSPVEYKQEKDLISFESVSAQLIAAANQNPFPNHKPYPNNLSVTVSKQPSSLPARPTGDQSSNPHSNVSSNPQVSNDLIVLDTVKATELMNHQLPSSNVIGPFEKDMFVIGKESLNDSPHPPGDVVTNNTEVATSVTNNPTTSNTLQFPQSSPRQQQHVSRAPPHVSTNQVTAPRGDQLSYRDGFGVSQSDMRCVEAMQAWVKAEMALAKGDKAVALLAYQKVSETLQLALQDPMTPANKSKVTAKRNDAIKHASELRRDMQSDKRLKQSQTPPTSRRQQCQKCGQFECQPNSDLCRPCFLRSKIS